MKRYTILAFFGTRPEAIKMAPVVERLREEKRFRVKVAVSAQHRDMLDQVLDLFGLRCDADLNLMKPGQSLFDVTAGVLRKFEPALKKIRPDMVLVHGDTTTTLAGALASYYQRIPVGHVEAGLRTHDRYRPFPEEMNRHLTDAVATLHFAPTHESKRNLSRENINPRGVFVTGNTVIDALMEVAGKDRPFKNRDLGRLFSGRPRNKRMVLITAHRRENFGKPFGQALNALKSLAERFRDIDWIYPVHPNPNVQGPARRALHNVSNFHLTQPVDYGDMVNLMKASSLVVTDSGGLQEEAPALGKPVLVLREVTERPEGVRAGTVKLVGTDKARIVGNVTRLLTNARAYQSMATAANPYGDGRAARRIADAVRWHFGLTRSRPRDFKER